MIKVSKENGKIYTNTPYNKGFVENARSLDGKWNAEDKTWAFDESHEDAVREILRNAYGTDGNESDEMVDVTITYHAPAYADLGSVMEFGRPVARAYGRDSGGKVVDGAILLEGEIISAGSRKNWYTEIRKGSVIKMIDVPKSLTENIENTEKKTYEIHAK